MLALLLPFVLAQAPAPKAKDPFARWEKAIAVLEAKLKEHPPKEGGVLFVGSSTVVLWNLKTFFPDKDYTNVGFGGSTIADCVHFAPRILLPYKPSTIVFAAGGNDLARGDTPEKVAEDFQAFVASVHKASPKCRIVYLSIKPTMKRWSMFDRETKANALIKAICAKDKRLEYLDVVPDLLGPEGKPRPEMLIIDGLHPSAAGYEVLTAKVKAALAK